MRHSLDFADFTQVCQALAARSCEVLEAQFQDRHFGSWFIDIDLEMKHIRLVWDGKEGWLKIQSGRDLQVADKWSGEMIAWEDLWIEREPDAGALPRALEFIDSYGLRT